VLELQPITLREANEFVRRHHQTHGPVQGAKFAIGVNDGERIVGVAICGRPSARHMDDGWTLEVTRWPTDGTRNAMSKLKRGITLAARGMGYRRWITYTREEEGGAAMRACGLRCVGVAGGGTWNRKERPRVDTHPTDQKLLWEAELVGANADAERRESC